MRTRVLSVIIYYNEYVCQYPLRAAPLFPGQQTDMMSCGFEDAAVCGWTGDPKSDFQWVRSQGVTYQVGTAPKRDHTLDRPEGDS